MVTTDATLKSPLSLPEAEKAAGKIDKVRFIQTRPGKFFGRHKRKLKWTVCIGLLIFVIWYIQCLPEKLFNRPTSTVMLDRNGILLGARIADDGQWRFAAGDSVPRKFEQCILQFEDRNFYSHFGVSVTGIGRSLIQNIKHRRVVSGGSTITMQVIRIMKNNPKRTYSEKIFEMLMATRLELRCSKREILGYYAANAPFGNNVVGLEAASWRYYGRSADRLSWAESATLAVLPNAPGLIYPGKNHERLLAKRNRLLKRLFDIQMIDESTYQLALMESLPDKPLPLPETSSHLLGRLIREGGKGKTVYTSLDAILQQKAAEVLQQQSLLLQENKVYNGAVLITSVKTGKVLAYAGNVASEDGAHGNEVDCISAPRSSGSILKPLLYEGAMEEGMITPNSLLIDVPSHFGSFAPKNFSQQFDGAVPASQALSRSLNVPFVRLLNDFGIEKFHDKLKQSGITTIQYSARHYGLSLILGGAEVKLWDLGQAYSAMAQTLEYRRIDRIGYLNGKNTAAGWRPMDRACIYSTFEAMTEVNRPDEDGNWKAFAGAQKIAWKTGTSYGFRDAWAVGITPDYVVSVWVGNADGEGRPGLTGVKAAAPLMFRIFGQLPATGRWFTRPLADMKEIKVCRQSGGRAGELCENTVQMVLPATCSGVPVCPYHHLVHLNRKTLKRVDDNCMNPFDILHTSWFILPPGIEKYYKYNHPEYKVLPDYQAGCNPSANDAAMAILYPRKDCKIYVPLEIDGNRGRTVLEAVHRNAALRIYWHLDNEYIGETKDIHQMTLNPLPGLHSLMIVDENGLTRQVNFEVEGR